MNPEKYVSKNARDLLIDFVKDMSHYTGLLRQVIQHAENSLDFFDVCGLTINLDGTIDVHLLYSSWVRLCATGQYEWTLESHYTSGEDALKPWNTRCFELAFLYEGCRFFCLLDGAEIDLEGLKIPGSLKYEALQHKIVTFQSTDLKWPVTFEEEDSESGI